MKKIIFALFALFLLVAFTSENFAQNKITRGAYVIEDLETMANSGQETCYLDLRGWSKVDSVVVSLSCTGEIDVDTINFYRGSFTPDGFIVDADAGVLYNAVTLNVAAAGTDFELLLTSGATVLTGAALRGVNGIKAVIEGASSGSDATDPNALYINWHIVGTKQ